MPGIVVHLAIANKYLENNNTKTINQEEFIKGSIAPDLNQTFDRTLSQEEKDLTHYNDGEKLQALVSAKRFFNDKKVNLSEDYWKGYFLHLFADYYFYNDVFAETYKKVIEANSSLYEDWDAINKTLIPKYNVKHVNNYLDRYMNINDSEPKNFTTEEIIDFIEKVAQINIQEEIEILKENDMKWRKLSQ